MVQLAPNSGEICPGLDVAGPLLLRKVLPAGGTDNIGSTANLCTSISALRVVLTGFSRLRQRRGAVTMAEYATATRPIRAPDRGSRLSSLRSIGPTRREYVSGHRCPRYRRISSRLLSILCVERFWWP